VTAVGPGWASLASADPQTVASFYRAVLGWAIAETDGRLAASAAGTPVADIADITAATGSLDGSSTSTSTTSAPH
jgi:predicted enzyme related to lactoylglutathione lyase